MLAVAPSVAIAFSPALHANVLMSKSSAAVSRQGRIGRTMNGALGARATATLPAETIEALGGDASNVELSGLNGLALSGIEYPSKKEVFQAIPEHCFKRDTVKSMGYAAVSAAMLMACVYAGLQIPLKLAMWPLWLLYSMVTGTVATGAWVIAHECGHGAFSDNKALQDAVSPGLKAKEHKMASSSRFETAQKPSLSQLLLTRNLAGWIFVPHSFDGALLLLAALPRCSPCQDKSFVRGRDTRALHN
jgi:hypothetical protein